MPIAVRLADYAAPADAKDAPVGLANCFEGFSTFAAKPLINIHDVFVIPAARGRGVVCALFAEIARIGRARGCCKITLEVLATNERAQAAYRREGFGGSAATLFWQKKLAP
jgi:ribosomal protein S18 acetylase RimI-like enzyme